MEEQKRQEQMLRQRMAEQEENNLDKQGSYTSLQDEVQDLDRKLKSGLKQYKKQLAENEDVRVEWEREKEELLEQIKVPTHRLVDLPSVAAPTATRADG